MSDVDRQCNGCGWHYWPLNANDQGFCGTCSPRCRGRQHIGVTRRRRAPAAEALASELGHSATIADHLLAPASREGQTGGPNLSNDRGDGDA